MWQPQLGTIDLNFMIFATHHCVTDDLGRSSSRQSSNATGRPIFSVSNCLIFCYQSPSCSCILFVKKLSLFNNCSLQVVSKCHKFLPLLVLLVLVPQQDGGGMVLGKQTNIAKSCSKSTFHSIKFWKSTAFYLDYFFILFNFKVLVQCTKLITLHTSKIIAVVIKSSRSGPAGLLSV